MKNSDYKPTILDLKKPKDKAVFMVLRKKCQIVDEFETQIRELNLVRNPKLLIRGRGESFVNISKCKNIWVYYPWRNYLVKILDKREYELLRLSRNHNLITPKEQKKFTDFRLSITGLNTGNSAALCIALEGGCNKMKFADNDILTVSNLNRFRAGLCDLGVNKGALSARQVYEINPFADIEVFEKGLSDLNLERFLLHPKVDLLVEEMDNLDLKIKIREIARIHKIPVLMVTGNGENVIIDVERFDINNNAPLLNGYLKPPVIEKIKRGTESFEEKIKLARDFMGAEYLVKRLQDSFKQVGKSLAGIPQLSESSFLRGAAVCFFVRQIVLGNKVLPGRYFLKLDSII